jgi:hypothetical protein
MTPDDAAYVPVRFTRAGELLWETDAAHLLSVPGIGERVHLLARYPETLYEVRGICHMMHERGTAYITVELTVVNRKEPTS